MMGYLTNRLAGGVQVVVFLFAAASVWAQVSTRNTIHYQGRIGVDRVLLEGTGRFKFAILDTDTGNSIWSHDGTSTGGAEPDSFIAIPVRGGLIDLRLGDVSVPNMTASIPPDVFAEPRVALRMWVSEDGETFDLLTPDQPISSAPFATKAGSVSPGSLGMDALADGAVTADKLAPGAVVENLRNSGVSFQPGFVLEGARQGLDGSRSLNWSPILGGSGEYRVFRNGTLVETLAHDSTGWTDHDVSVPGLITYVIRGVQENGANGTFSELVSSSFEFRDTVVPTFGNGSDGVFEGGVLDRSRNHFFTEVNLADGAEMSFTGAGQCVIRVQGDVTLGMGATIRLRGGDLASGDVSIDGITRSLSADPYNYGQGGGTGGTGAGGSSGAGVAGANNSTYPAARGGAGGAAGGGHGGDAGYYFWTGNQVYIFAQGGGGGAGQHGNNAEGVVFVAGGDINLQGAIEGRGGDGGQGGNGGRGFTWEIINLANSQNDRHSIGTPGHGGAGGAGGHGARLYFFGRGGFNASQATLDLNGGAGGSGGNGGLGTNNQPAGQPGGQGGGGKAGSIEFIPID